ncbi:IS630 family transposase [Gorillibacterium timonense]|uniref:IS630 family transposase n=1 Tax=Gorillibacterium timonense TaxID=1689269 RepID=UPI001F3AA433|nr:IS630 family transposase [Gorillibacterium timonense]
MRPISYPISLSEEERNQLTVVVSKGKASARAIRRAHILLAADKNREGGALKEREIAERLGVHPNTVYAIRKAYTEQGLDGAVKRKKRVTPPVAPKITGEVEARIIALSCSAPPEGRSRWTLHLLANRAVELQYVEGLSYETVRQVLKKNELKPHLHKCWCIPPEQNATFVAAMEDVLDVYRLPYDADCPVICMDEKPYQLLDEARQPIPMKPAQPERQDSEYVRVGTCSIFLFTDPLGSWRHVSVREQRTRIEWAEQIRELLDVHYKDAPKIRLVMDNLNTHAIASLYQAFDPQTARRLAKRIEVHYTPKHGSWLNMAEIELSVLTSQCLGRRIPSIADLTIEMSAWEQARNLSQKGVDWQFTTEDARIKLKRLYPRFKN